MSKNNRVTIYDLAQELGLAPSTISRALKDEHSISEETKKLVWEFAEKKGYRKNILASGLKTRPVKIGFIVRSVFPEFQKLLIAGAQKAESDLADYNVSLDVTILDVENYDYLLPTRIAELADEGYEGVIFAPASKETFPLIDQCIENKGIFAATLYHNEGFKNVDFVMGADYARSGHIAAGLMHLSGLKKGDKVIYFNASNELRQHKVNREAFIEDAKKYGFKVIEGCHFDISKVAEKLTFELLKDNPNVKAIYTSSAICVPIVSAIKKSVLKNKPLVIATELLDTNVSYVKDGTIDAVIFQNPFKLAHLTVTTMYKLIMSKKLDGKPTPINPQIVLPANLSFYADRITHIGFDADY